MTEKKLFTSESVSEGHPDKLADQISDAILDAILADDPDARVACEVLVTTGLVLIAGEIRTTTYVDMQKIARDTIRDVGYTRAKYGFDADTCSVLVSIDDQSPDIADGVDTSYEYKKEQDVLDKIGAGDQGLMFGYATKETKEYMPLPISLAHKLTRRVTEVRKKEILNCLRPDAKAQVTVEYDQNNKVKRIDAIVLSVQHHPEVSREQLEKSLKKEVIDHVVPEEWLDDQTAYYINPTGRFVIGGPQGDAGLTGRKIVVDTYGGYARHGGGAFSGKDATKVDRSASYAARYIAKNIVAADLADEIEVQLAYAIGVAQPVSINVNAFGSEKVDLAELTKAVRQYFDLRPEGIIQMLDLKRPIYKQTAAYGHFGRADLDLPWEALDKVDDLKSYFS